MANKFKREKYLWLVRKDVQTWTVAEMQKRNKEWSAGKCEDLPYKINFYAWLQDMATLSLSWFGFMAALEIPGCCVFPGFPQTSGYLLIWKAVTEFLRRQSISVLAGILFLPEVQCNPEPHPQFNCVLGWEGAWASCHRRQSTKMSGGRLWKCTAVFYVHQTHLFI